MARTVSLLRLASSAMLEQFVDYLWLKDLIIMVQDWGGPTDLGRLRGDRSSFVR